VNVSSWAKKGVDPVEARALDRLSALKPKDGKPGRVIAPFPKGEDAPYDKVVGHDEMHRLIKHAPLKAVPLASLVTNGQESVRADQVAHYVSNKGEKGYRHGKASTDHPIVVRVGGKDTIFDGHHRATAASLRGEKEIRARYVDLDSRSKKSAP
jgi:hypothetical protein